MSIISEKDVELLKSGKHFTLFDVLGSRNIKVDGKVSTYFAVWAPNARAVSLVGDFNGWDENIMPLTMRRDGTGIWEGAFENIQKGSNYKYAINTIQGLKIHKGDPYAVHWETPPAQASKTWDLDYSWSDSKWMKERAKHNGLDRPISVYEVHLGSWKKPGKKQELDFYDYRTLAHDLCTYIKEMGFTHVELMPVMEHPYYPSWGYQIHGYFAPTSRYGTPQDFMYFVDHMHQNGIGVFLDWVPSHFVGDLHGLYRFDGTALYEHEDKRKGYHPDWKTYIFNYGRYEVKSFLISNAVYWLEKFHLDGLRVDAVASMLHLNYSRNDGEWIPNKYGGNENLEAIEFLKELNQEVYGRFPDVQMIAEESTTFPKVSKPVFEGGLGFGMKWMMGWMNDSIEYMKNDPLFRKHQHNKLIFSIVYAFSENFMLPFSHDEVVHGKSSMLMKMPGPFNQKFDHLAVLYGYMFAHPGTKLLFMGNEIGQTHEWRYAEEIPWDLLQFEPHQKIQTVVKSLNLLYKTEPALYEKQFSFEGFEWIRSGDWQKSIIIFKRKGNKLKDTLYIICNFTPVVYENFNFGVDLLGQYEEIYCTNKAEEYLTGKKQVSHKSKKSECDALPYTLNISVPGLSMMALKKVEPKKKSV